MNRALLARQLLLERTALPIPQALEQLAGIQNQYAPNAYIRLWSCLADFRRGDLTSAYREGTVLQGTLMRGTIHAVSARDYRLFAAAVRGALYTWARRTHGGDGSDRGELVARIRAALAGRSVTRAELYELRGRASDSAWATLNVDAALLRVPPSGTWERRRADLFALADDVLGQEEDPPESEALEHLVRRYLAGFGPARAQDVASFTGVPISVIRPVLGRIELRRFRDEAGKELLDVPDAPLPDEDAAAPVRFLPTWDAVLLVHARRTHVLPEAYRPLLFSPRTPFSFNTFLVNGQVAGTWRYESGNVTISPFRELSGHERRAVNDEADRMAAFHAG